MSAQPCLYVNMLDSCVSFHASLPACTDSIQNAVIQKNSQTVTSVHNIVHVQFWFSWDSLFAHVCIYACMYACLYLCVHAEGTGWQWVSSSRSHRTGPLIFVDLASLSSQLVPGSQSLSPKRWDYRQLAMPTQLGFFIWELHSRETSARFILLFMHLFLSRRLQPTIPPEQTSSLSRKIKFGPKNNIALNCI